jgi:hypothetical protein
MQVTARGADVLPPILLDPLLELAVLQFTVLPDRRVRIIDYILNTPTRRLGNGALSEAAMARARTVRVSAGSMMPSSQRRAVL